MPSIRLLAAFAVALVLACPALGADWVAVRLRGDVQVLAGEQWVPLRRGEVVANTQLVRTLATGHAELQRGEELVTLGSNTEIRIEDDAATGYTTVLQNFGRVEVDAEARRVKHFEVQTSYLAAVVKGTHFVVTADSNGASVSVDRGSVAVHSVATERSTTIGVGQMATVGRKSDLVVSGLGPWPPIVDPGVSRSKIAASLGSALGGANGDGAGSNAIPAASRGAPLDGQRSGSAHPGGMRVVAAMTKPAASGGYAGAGPRTSADAEPTPPVSPGVVLLGAVFGAALGGLALLFRRGI